VNQQLWWHVARAGGLVAWWLASLSVLWGLTLSTRLVRTKGAPAWLLDSHRFLGALTVAFTGLHIGGIVADDYVEFDAAAILLPFASQWRPGAVAWGVIALHLLIAIEVTSLLMRKIRRSLWRAVHFTSFVLFAFATVHAFTAGADADNALVQWSALVIAGTFVFLVIFRQLAGRRTRVATA
jgi:hypothetical protein